MKMWTFSSRRSDFEQTVDLRLAWEVTGDPVSDYYTPEESSAAELWSIWRGQYPEDRLDIAWFVRGDNVAEFAPRAGLGASGDDFLTYFTWPVDTDGNLLRWTDLPVEDKLWNSVGANKGGFIQEHSGWKPSPFQQQMDVAVIERILGGSPHI
jgi:hypothetical protein